MDKTLDEKYAPIALGVKGRPYPMMIPSDIVYVDGEEVLLSPTLGLLEDALVFSSARPYDQVMGMFYRDMPVPSMLRTFYKALERRSDTSTRKVQSFFGPPGVGKTFMPSKIGEARDPRGPIVIDCGGMNLEELLFETVLDTDADKSIFKKLENKIAEGTINPASIASLKSLLSYSKEVDGKEQECNDIFIEENGKVSIDWASTNKMPKDKLANLAKELNIIAANEGISTTGDAFVIKSRKGPIIRAWEEGREIILDEFNKSQDGSEGKMQILWQIFTGEIKTPHTVSGGGGLSFTFDPAKMPKGFFITVTGNESEDGSATHGLSESLYRRLQPEFLPRPDKMDFQHRICQALCGLPVSTLYYSNKEKWDENPQAFTKFLEKLYDLGKTEEQVKNSSTIKKDLLKNWKNVIEVSDRLSDFYKSWDDLTNPEKATGDLSSEIDEDYKRELGFGMSTVLKHVNEAFRNMPKVSTSSESNGFDVDDDWSVAPTIPTKVDDLAENFGANLCQSIISDIEETAARRGKVNLFKQLLESAKTAGIVSAKLDEGTSNDRATIAELLNTKDTSEKFMEEDKPLYSNVESHVTNTKSEDIRNSLCDYLRTLEPTLPSDNDAIIKTSEVKLTLDMLISAQKRMEDDRARFMIVPNPEFLADNSGEAQAFALVPTNDTSPVKDVEITFDAKEDLMDHKKFLKILTMPEIGERNIVSMFNRVFDETFSNDPLEEQRIAQNTSPTGVAATTLVCKTENNGELEDVIFRVVTKASPEGRKTIIASTDPIDDELKEALKVAGITHISADETGAQAKLRKEICHLVGPNNIDDTLGNISEAFTYRCESVKLIKVDDKGIEITDTNEAKPKIIYREEIAKDENDTSPEYDGIDKDGNKYKVQPVYEEVEARMLSPYFPLSPIFIKEKQLTRADAEEALNKDDKSGKEPVAAKTENTEKKDNKANTSGNFSTFMTRKSTGGR